MLAVGRDRAADRGLLKGLAWTTGDAESLPFPDRSFDGYTIAFGLRNVTDIDKALARSASRAEAGRPLLLPGVQQGDVGADRPRLRRLFRAARCRSSAASSPATPSPTAICTRASAASRRSASSAERMREAGFANVAWRDMTLGVVALHSGWRI